MMIFDRTMNEYQWFAILCAIILTLLYGACLAYYYTGNRYQRNIGEYHRRVLAPA